MTKLAKRVQACLKNKGGNTKYLLSGLLELYQLHFPLIYCISMYIYI